MAFCPLFFPQSFLLLAGRRLCPSVEKKRKVFRAPQRYPFIFFFFPKSLVVLFFPVRVVEKSGVLWVFKLGVRASRLSLSIFSCKPLRDSRMISPLFPSLFLVPSRVVPNATPSDANFSRDSLLVDEGHSHREALFNDFSPVRQGL